jgi:hypothetical protein
VANKLQRKVLWQFIKEGGRGLIITGNKSTSWGDTLKIGGAIIYCSECVKGGLVAGKLVEKETLQHSGSIADRLYRITTAGVRAAGKAEPEMRSVTGAHGPRWS